IITRKLTMHFPTRTKLNSIIEKKNKFICILKNGRAYQHNRFLKVIYILLKFHRIFIYRDIVFVLIAVLYGAYIPGSLNFVYYKAFFGHLYYAVFHRGLHHDHLLP